MPVKGINEPSVGKIRKFEDMKVKIRKLVNDEGDGASKVDVLPQKEIPGVIAF